MYSTNPVGDRQLTSPARRPALQRSIFFADSQPVLTSAINRLESQLAISTVGSQLLAAIAENPDVDDLAKSFRIHGFAHQTDSAASAAKRIDFAYRQILDDANGQPLAVAASPVQLTPFGEAANHGGLSPGTARILRSTLGEIADRPSSRVDLVGISVTLLKSLAGVPEQGNPDLRKAVLSPNSRPVVRLDELELVLDLWLAGESIETIFAALPTNKRSKRRPGLQAWLQGVPEDSTWTDQFAKFYDFVNGCVEFFLPWILRAARPLAELDGQLDKPWIQWARFVELGVSSTWGALLMDGDAITESKVAFQVGQRLDALAPDQDPTIEQVRQVLTEYVDVEHETASRVLGWFQRRSASLQEGDL